MSDQIIEPLLLGALTAVVIAALLHGRVAHRSLEQMLRTAEHEADAARRRAAELEAYEQEAARLRAELAIVEKELRLLRAGRRDGAGERSARASLET